MSDNIRFTTVRHLIKKLLKSNKLINSRNVKPFPKEEARWLSHYKFRKENVSINDDGSVPGGIAQLICSTIDFSFIRSIAAVAYSIFGGPCYDPVSLFLLDLFRCLEKSPSVKDFCRVLHDPFRGQIFRRLAGISLDCVPCEATFSNFRNRLGESLYQEIFHALLSIAEETGLVSFNMLATDGTLFPSAARYHGCHCFQDSCASISVDNIIQKIRDRVLYRIEDPSRLIPGKESWVSIECPCPNFPEDVKRPKIKMLSFTLEHASNELSAVDTNNLRFFRVEEQLTKLGIVLRFPQSNVHAISLSSLLGETSNTFRFRCPKLPHDRTARIGVRRKPSNPDKIEKIFGYNAVICTSIGPQWGLELPVACITIAGNAEEGKQVIPLHQQILKFHGAKTLLHLLDAKYDELPNYEYARKNGAVALISYNTRNENITHDALIERGYDRNGWPYVPYCHLPTRPNGFDSAAQRVSFSCFKQCVKSNLPAHLELYRNCPHRSRLSGYSTHVSIAQHPRLILEIPRGTERFRQLFALRSAAERTNSSLKEDFPILRKPPVRSLRRAAVVAQLGVITLLVDRIAGFFIDRIIKERKFKASGDEKWADQLSPPDIPAFLRPFVKFAC
ncbi:MAG: transposase [Acidobacteria bacterium]|nr:transposase [Acidobacteriota bacterium]